MSSGSSAEYLLYLLFRMSRPPIIVTEAFPVVDDQVARTHSTTDTTQVLPNPNDEEQTDIVKFLAQLQLMNPTRSALLAQVQQLVFQIEHDKRLYPGDRSLLLNESMRTTIRKLEEDFNKRGFNRANCPVRRDLMFHYANLYIKYHEIIKEKKSPTPLNAPAIGEEVTHTNNDRARAQETSIWEDIRRRRNEVNNNTGNRTNVFNERIVEGRRERNKEITRQTTKHMISLLFFLPFILAIYFFIRWMFSPRTQVIHNNL